MSEPTYGELRALILELDAAPYSLNALRGRNEGLADLNLRIPKDTVKRLWRLAKALKAQRAETVEILGEDLVRDMETGKAWT